MKVTTQAASWGVAAPWLGLGDNLASHKVVGPIDASQWKRLDFTSGQRLRMLVWRPWSAGGLPVQRGLWAAGSCGIIARAAWAVGGQGWFLSRSVSAAVGLGWERRWQACRGGGPRVAGAQR